MLLLVGWYEQNQAEWKRKREAAKTYSGLARSTYPRVNFSIYNSGPGGHDRAHQKQFQVGAR